MAGDGALEDRPVELQGVAETGGPDQPAGVAAGADHTAATTGGGELAADLGQRTQGGAVPEADGGDVHDELSGAQARRLEERVGEQWNGGEIGVSGEPDDDLVGCGDECDVEKWHGFSGGLSRGGQWMCGRFRA